MRDSLRRSIADSPATGFESYAKGSVVVCQSCAHPIFKLDRAITLGDTAGRMASAFKPLGLIDLAVLQDREDIDAGVRALVKGWSLEQRRVFIAKLREVRAGDPMTCPNCADCFVLVLSVDVHELLDKAYTIELVTIPPSGKVTALRGRRLGAGAGWVH
jgi:hypothetical protein